MIRATGLMIGVFVVGLCVAASIAAGKQPIALPVILDSFLHYDELSRDHIIVQYVRVPRAFIAMAVGACMAVAGAIMQGITRNALAGPELFGINQGAALMIVCHIFLFGGASSSYGSILLAFAGAGLAGLLVFGLGSLGRGGLSAIRLILAGSTLNLLLASLTQGILVFDEESLDTMRFWLAGSLVGRSSGMLLEAAPFLTAGMIGAILLSRHINLVSLGDEVAQGLGQRVGWIRAGSLGAVLLLAGGSVSIAGPIAFVGLAVPHIVRYVTGNDYRWVIPYSAIVGAVLLLLADIAARFIFPSQELSAGIVTALLGAPFLIYLAQRRS